MIDIIQNLCIILLSISLTIMANTRYKHVDIKIDQFARKLGINYGTPSQDQFLQGQIDSQLIPRDPRVDMIMDYFDLYVQEKTCKPQHIAKRMK